MARFQPEDYGPTFAPLLSVDRRRSLGPGRPDASIRAALAALDPAGAFGDRPITDSQMAALCFGAVWLLGDHLDESHRISQSVSTNSGSYWHGMMHRREPDYGNSGYWFRRVGNHPVFVPLLEEASRLVGQTEASHEAARLVAGPQWDPFAFIDLCQTAYRSSSADELLCQQIQQREWELLFDFCYRGAVGG